MSVPVLTFFNNKGGVGKTSLAYHLAWMFSELGYRVLAADLDPQANLTAAFLDEDRLAALWQDDRQPNTVFRCVRPLLGVGDLVPGETVTITSNLALLPGDLALAGFEDQLSEQWPKSMADTNLERPFRVLTGFWHVVQQAAQAIDADLIFIDVGPHLGALNRSALIATDHVLIPLGADLFSLEGLRHLGPILRSWRAQWKRRLDNWSQPAFPVPAGEMAPVGYVAQQHGVRLNRPTKAYDRWIARIPLEYRTSVLGQSVEVAPSIQQDPHCLALLKHYRSLAPLAMEARKPMFLLRVADGAIGAHSYSVQDAYRDYRTLAQRIIEGIGLERAA